MHTQKIILAISLVTALSACGGGSSTPTNPSAPVSNISPVANAGANQSVTAGAVVTLNSSASSDGNSDALTYTWTLSSKPVGSLAALTSPKSAQPSFTADMTGSYVATLIVNDGKVDSAATTVTITAGAKAGSTATLIAPANGKTPWNIASAAQFSLKDASGNIISGPLTCSSDTPATLIVAADCSSVTGKRLGNQSITIASGGISATASVKVIPQPQPLAINTSKGYYNLVVTTEGRVLAWGTNASGQLGQGKLVSVLKQNSLPLAVKDTTGLLELKGIVAVSAGEESALALSEDGEVYSWGNNSSGQLGRTVLNDDPLPGKVVSPTGTSTLQHIVAISVGEDNAIALADDGRVYSWGYYSGQAGSGSKKVPGIVRAVSGDGELGNAVSISAGWNWNAVLLADGRVVTWGFDNDGRLGQGTTNHTEQPGYVLSLSSGQPISGILAISAGYNFGMALSNAGQIYAWGNNDWGQIGQNFSGSNTRQTKAVLVKAVDGNGILSDIKMFSAGGNHALALDGGGKVYSWGYAQNGELGDGANHPRVNESPLPAAVVSATGTGQLSGISALAAGYSHSMALTSDGNLLIWGIGAHGNLGQGETSESQSYVPLLVKNEAGSAPLSLGSMTYWPNLFQRGN
jgi:alpha-tubulin suppressor-like RCC1 family protein